MRKFNKISAWVIVILIAVCVAADIYIIKSNETKGRTYMVEAERVLKDIDSLKQGDAINTIDLDRYEAIKQIVCLKDMEETEFFKGSGYDYLIRKVNGEYYRIDYISNSDDYTDRLFICVNIVFVIIILIVISVMAVLKIKIIKPFNRLKDVPYELSKGNYVIPLKENKNRYFGKFVWGMELLRENLEEKRKYELQMQKEKKTLILSISHDIKTPLSAIKLYSRALSGNLYSELEKQKEIAEKINSKADEIENFVSQIIKASREDFLNLTVNNGEFYISSIMNRLEKYYADKMELVKINFKIEMYSDCILKGDEDRAVEVIENMVENAIKYGDGRWITIEQRDEEGCRLVTVKNSGISLNEAELPHVFDSFYRGSNTGNSAGSGLGLYICRQLMNKMGGEIFADVSGDSTGFTAVFVKI